MLDKQLANFQLVTIDSINSHRDFFLLVIPRLSEKDEWPLKILLFIVFISLFGHVEGLS